MKLIYYRGLNCHLACIINVMQAIGITHQQAYAGLWSETDFFYNTKYKIYTSNRVMAGIKNAGAQINTYINPTKEEIEAVINSMPKKELFIVGMDTFHIPWNPVYQHFHGPHFFIVQKDSAPVLRCFDPVYSRDDVTIEGEIIYAHAVELVSLTRTVPGSVKTIFEEAQEVICVHPKCKSPFLKELENLVNKEHASAQLLIKRVDAMINNRYLFEKYLHQISAVADSSQQFFDKKLLSRWEAVKNGLYKALIIKENRAVVEEVCDLVCKLLEEETEIAQQLLAFKQPI